MEVRKTSLPGVVVLVPKIHGDSRGFFMETFHAKTFARLGIPHLFVQDNHSRSAFGVTRGLHYQRRHGQGKLVRVVRGSVFDVAVDVRPGSPTFGQWFGELLTEENGHMMYVPEGFAHGFQVTSETADFLYKCTDFYSPEDDEGIFWNDPALGIAWPLPQGLVSEKDSRLPLLSEVSRDRLPRL
ncbi:MAG: dTDP-4-dehydrorhamnose 3,5-epimerase [Leptospirillia bacterium]